MRLPAGSRCVAFRLFPWAALLALCGCSAGPKYLVKDYSPPASVAVLPFTNDTNDVSAPETVRKVWTERLPARGYRPAAPEETDRVLSEKFGITEGGQLNSQTPQKLGEALGVESLFYGNVVSFVDFPFGFGRKRTVRAGVKLVDARTGDLLWEDEKSWTTPELHLDAEAAKRAAVRQVAERQLEKMTGRFLRFETEQVVERMLRNLPRGR